MAYKIPNQLMNMTGADYANALKLNKQNAGLPIFGNGIVGNLVGGAGSAFLGGVGDVAQFAGATGLGNALNYGAESIEEHLRPAKQAEFSWDYLTSPEGLARGIGNLGGSIASIAFPTIPFGGVIGAGAKLLSKVPKLGRLGEGFLKEGLRGAMTGPMEAAMEAGNYERNALLNGVDPKTARENAWGVFGRNVGLLTASNALQFGLFNKVLNGTGWKSRLASAGANAGIQGLEEGYQQGAQLNAEGKPYTYNPFSWFDPQYASQGQAAMEGLLPMLAIGGAGFGIGSARNAWRGNGQPQPKQEDQKQPAMTFETLSKYANSWIDQQMSNGTKVCVEAATKIGSGYSQFLREELNKGVVGVAQLRNDAKAQGLLVPYDEDNLQAGDILGWKDDKHSHVVVYDGKGGYFGNSSVQNKIVHSDTSHNYGKPDWVIKTGGNNNQSTSSNAQPTQPNSNQNQSRNGNVFGVENYNMPTQSDRITQQVSQLKPGWNEIIPQIGGALKNKFGINATISSAARSAEHNAAVGGVATSHHIIRENGGDALDMVFDKETTAAERQKILDYFKGTGMFKEVIYHNAGSGYHLHIGGLNADKILNAQVQNKAVVKDDPNFSALQNKMWRMAQRAAARANAQGFNIKPEWIYGQWSHEAVPTFDSDLAKRDHNYGGLKSTKGVWRHYNSPEEFADSYVDDFVLLRPELKAAKSAEDFVHIMGQTGYFDPVSDNEPAYLASVKKYGAAHPNTEGYEESEDDETSTEETATRNEEMDKMISDLIEKEDKPLFKLEEDSEISKNIFQNFVEDKTENATAEEIAKYGELLQSFYNDKGELQNTKENRLALAEAIGGDTLKNLGQENLNSKVEEYRKFQQSQVNPLQREVEKLEEKHRQAQESYDAYKADKTDFDIDVAKAYRQQVIDSKKELEEKVAQLNRATTQSKPQRIESLQNEISELESRRTARQKDLEIITKERADIEDTRAAKPEWQPSKQTLTNLEWREGLTQRQIDNLQQALNAKNAELEKARTFTAQQYRIDKLQNEIAQLESRKSEIQKNDSRSNRLEGEFQYLEPTNNNLKELESIQQKIDSRTARLEQLKNNFIQSENNQPSAENQPVEKFTATLNEGAKKSKGDDKVLKLLEYEGDEIKFNPTAKNSVMAGIVEEFAKQKLPEDKKFFKPMFEYDKFKRTKNNLEEIAKKYGEELQEFGQNELNKKLEEVKSRYKIERPVEREAVEVFPEEKEIEQAQQQEQTPQEKSFAQTQEKTKQILSEYAQGKSSDAEIIKQAQDLMRQAVANKDNKNYFKIYGALRDRDIKAMQKMLAENAEQTKSLLLTENIQRLNSRNEKLKSKLQGKVDEFVGKNKPAIPIQTQEEKPSKAMWELKVELDDLKEDRNALQKDLDAAMSGKNYAKADEVEKQIDALDEEIQAKQTEIEDFKKSPEHLEDLQKDLKELEEQRGRVERQIKKYGKTASRTKLQETLNQQILSIEKEIAEIKNPTQEENFIEDEEKFPIKKVGAKFVVSGGKNPKALKELSESLGGKYVSKDNNFAFSTLKDAQEFLKGKFDAENAPSGEYDTGLAGNETVAETDGHKKIKMRLKIIPASALNTSYKLKGDDVFKNESYPEKLQPRNRTDASLKMQVIKMRNNLDTDHLGENILLNEGAPVVREDGTVLNGNGRAMAIESAYNEGKAKDYKKFLTDNAEKFGFKASEIEEIEKPVLVREVTQELDDQTTNAIIKSRAGGASFKATEQAITDAESIRFSDFDDYNANEDGDISTAGNYEFRDKILHKIATEDENTAYRVENSFGEIEHSGEAIRRIKNAIYALAYSDYNLISKNAESTSDDIKNISSAAEKAAVDFARLKLKQREGKADEYDIGGVIAEAIKTYDAAKRDTRFKTIREFINQDTNRMFDARQQAIYDAMEVFDANKRNSERIKDFLKDVARRADRKENPDQTGLDFGNDVESYKQAQIDEIVRAAKDKVLQSNEADLFAEVPETKKAANKGEQDTSKAKLAEGYKTESGRSLQDADRNEFIIKHDGSKDFGQITEEVAKVANENLKNAKSKAKMKPAPIRLQVGNEHFGYIHLVQRHLAQIQDKGFDNAIDFINHTLKNFNQIYDQSHAHKATGKFINRFVLYCKGDESKGFMPVDLELEKGKENYYTVISANPHNEKIKGALVFDDSSKSSSVAATDSLIEDTNNENGVVSPRANAKTNSPVETIPQKQESGKKESAEIENENEERENAIIGRINHLMTRDIFPPTLKEVQEDLKSIIGRENYDKISEFVEKEFNKLNDALNSEEGMMHLAGLSNRKNRKAEVKSADSGTKDILLESFGFETDHDKHIKRSFENRKKKIYKKLNLSGGKYPNLKAEIDKYFEVLLEEKMNGTENSKYSDEERDAAHRTIDFIEKQNDDYFTDEKLSSAESSAVENAYKKKKEQVLDVTSPKPNVQNDPALSSEQTITQKQNSGKEEKPVRQRIFATQEEADRELKAAFGVTDEEIPKNKFVNFFDDSDDNIERLKAKWKKEINKTSAMPMFNPELWTTALELGGIYIQRGINNFATWTKEMTKALGEESKVWHGAVWESLKTMPEKGKFNDRQISAIANKIGGMYEDGKTSLEEIQKDFEKVLNENYQSDLEPIIKSTFKGIEKFFAENVKQDKSNTESEKIQQRLEDVFDRRKAFLTYPLDKDKELIKAKEIFKDFYDKKLSKADAIEKMEKFSTQLAKDNPTAYKKFQNLLNDEDNYAELLTDEEKKENKKRQVELEAKTNAEMKELKKAMEDFYSDKLINTDAVDKALADEDSFLSEFLEENDVDAYGNITPKKSKKNKSAKKEEENINEQSELGESGRTNGGHQVRESELRTTTDEETRQEGRDKVSEKLSGQQRQDAAGIAKGDNGTNAANLRPDAVQGKRTESERTGEGTGVRGSQSVVQSAASTERGSSGVSGNVGKVEFSGHNFKITDDNEIGTGGEKTKFKQNIDAIKLLKQLESEGRKATPSEQKILSKFNGWGTVAGIFTDKENAQLKEILTDEEYESAIKATNNAFYTHPKIAQAMWQGLERLGFKGGRILDPATGNGIFFGTMPSEMMAKSELTGVEYDDLSGRIARQLYQKAAIEIKAFQKRKMPNNYFDLVITNVPFEQTRIVSDKEYSKQGYMLHNYYFAKAIDKVRPGGLVAFITSQGTMRGQDEQSKRLREELNGKADLIAAYKLPNNAFEKNAGTKVTSDILILQKRLDPKQPSEYAQSWSKIENTKILDESRGYKLWLDVPINEYFKAHPENMIGEPVIDATYQRQRYDDDYRMALDGKGRDETKELPELMSKLPQDIFVAVQNQSQDTLKNTFLAMADDKEREGTFSLKDGKVVQNVDGGLLEIKENQQVIKDFLKLEKSFDNLTKAELSPETTNEKLSELRERLNKNYDDFVKNNGYLNAKENLKILGKDSNYGKVAAIEIYKENKKVIEGKKGKKKTEITVSANKADIFYKRTVNAIQQVNSADNAFDALRLSLSRRGAIDTDYMSKLTGKNAEELAKELGDLVYKNPETNYIELAEEYLSGNVREKLTYAKEAAQHNPEFRRNVEALEKVLPVDLTEKEIFPHMGANWIDEKYYYDFVKDLVGESKNIKITRDKFTGRWKVSGWIPHDKNVQWRITRERRDEDFVDLLEGALNHHYPTFTSNKVQQKEEMAEARDKIDKITEEFDKWIWQDEERKKDLVETYNQKFNGEVERHYDGSNLELPGLNEEIKQKLYPHQKDAIWRILQGKNTLLAHTVGAGKTWEMVISAMEMKRIGMISKPLFAVPNNIVEQFAREFRMAYPNANLLILTSDNLKEIKPFDSKKEETEAQENLRFAIRRKTLSQIATNNWDGIIISHNLFERLPMSLDGALTYSRDGEKIAKAKAILANNPSKDDIKKAAEIIKAAEEHVDKDFNNFKAKELITPFEELGIDQIFVDESDMFKNLGFNTTQFNPSDPNKENRIVGVSTADAQRSRDLYAKARWLSSQRNGGGLVFASGTPVSNTLNEIYTIQRYLDPELLAENEWAEFDDWANHFGKTVPTTETDAAGNYVQKRRLNLNNLPALIKFFRKIADIKMIEDLPHLLENRPKLKGEERRVIPIKPTEAFEEYKKVLLKRNEALHKAKTKAQRDELNDNYLKIVGDFRKASLDMRLIDPSYSEEEAGGKINAVCDSVFAKFKETADVKGAQLVFLDLSTPKAKKQNAQGEDIEDDTTSVEEVTVYDKIKKGLIKRGIPANQIAFVHEAKTANQKKNLFDKVNEGDIRIIIGSTAKMGAGTNFQKHLVALHHVDCPWRPRDVEQREGRILRNGNLNKEVEIFTYVTKGSYDAINWDLVARKQAMIDSLMRGDPTVTEIEDVSDIAADYRSIAAVGDDNPLKKELREVEEKVLRLKSSQKLHLKNQKESQSRAAKLRQNEIPAVERRVKNLQADAEKRPNLFGDKFSVKLGDKVYTKFADAKNAFEKTVNDFKKLSPEKIGEIGGFEIVARTEFTQAVRGGVLETIGKQVYLKLEKNGNYDVDSSLESIRNFISGDKGTSIVKLLDKEKLKLDNLKGELAGLTEKIRQPFDKQAELDAAEKRLAEIQSQIVDKNNVSTEPIQQTSTAEKSDSETTPQEKNYPDKPSEVKNQKAAVKVTGDEFGEYTDLKELRQKAIQYYKDNLQGTSVENETLGKIDIDENGLVEFTGEGKGKIRSNSAQEDTLFLIKHLPELIKNAENISHKEAESEKHKKLGDSFYYLDTEFDKNGESVPLRITLKKLHTGDIHYYNHIINPQNKEDVSVSSGTESSNEANVSPTVNTSSAENISQSEANSKEINPFEEADNLPEKFQTEHYKKAYGEMQDAWSKYKSGELDSRELLNTADKIISDYQKNSKANLNYTEEYARGFDSLSSIKEKFEDEHYSPENQAKNNQAWEDFLELRNKFSDMHDDGKVSDKDYASKYKKISSLVTQVQNRKITASKAYEKLKELIDEKLDKENSKTYDNKNDAEEKELIKAILDAPVGTKIISRNGIGKPTSYLITGTDSKKKLSQVDENGKKVGSYQDLVLSRANVTKYFGAGREHGYKLRTGEVTVVLPETSTEKNSAEIEIRARQALKSAGLENKFVPKTKTRKAYPSLYKFEDREVFNVSIHGLDFRNISYDYKERDKLNNFYRPIVNLSEKFESEYYDQTNLFSFKYIDDAKTFAEAVKIYLNNGNEIDDKVTGHEEELEHDEKRYRESRGLEIVSWKEKYYRSKNSETKFAGRGNLEKMFENAKRLAENELNNQQKKWIEFGENYGLKIVWIDADKDLKGAVEGGTIYLNALNNKNISRTFYHEQFHMLSALNPQLHNDLLEHFRKTFTAKQLDAYRKENQREDLSDAEVIEEILSDNFEQAQSRVKLLQEMSKENPNLLKRFIAYLKNLADKFVSIFRSPQGGMTREQRDAFIQKFNSLAGNLKDAYGNKLFTTYKGGKELKTADGKEIEKVPLKFAAENFVDNSDKKIDNVENHLTDKQKTNLFNFVKRHIENHIADRLDEGVSETEIVKELNSENSRHRAGLLGKLKANLNDLKSRANDKVAKRLAVEKINKITGLNDSQIDSLYKKMVDEWQEMVNYGGVLYREIALNRRTDRGQSDRFLLSSWRDAERQRDEREGRTGNKIEDKHSGKQGAFSLDEKISAAIKADSSVETLIKQLGGKLVNGKLQADDKTKAKIESQFDSDKWKHSIAWHGTPHNFDSFTLDAIGTGEGAQVHGWGLYFAGDREVSEGYRERLAGKYEIPNFTEIFPNDGSYLYDGTESLEEIMQDMIDDAEHERWNEGYNVTTPEAIQAFFENYEANGCDADKAISSVRKLAASNIKMYSLSKEAEDDLYRLDNAVQKVIPKRPGRLFKVDIPNADVMIDESKRWRNQPKKVKNSIKKLISELSDDEVGLEGREVILDNVMNDPIRRGGDIYQYLAHFVGGEKAASKRLNEYGIKGITYEGNLDGRCYVVFDDKAIKILEKYSLQGTGNTSISNFVDDDKLTSQQKLLKDFGDRMGVHTVFFRNANKDFHGAHNNGVTYLNVNSKVPLNKVFWHEALHWLKSNNESLYNELAKAADLTDEQLQNYLDTTGRKDLKNRGEITEEILADSMHKLLDRVTDKNILQKIISWLQDTLQKFKEMFRNPKGGLKTEQYKKLADKFKDIATSFKDENGNKIFRYNPKTKSIELASGERLPKTNLRFNDSEKTIDNDERIRGRIAVSLGNDGRQGRVY